MSPRTDPLHHAPHGTSTAGHFAMRAVLAAACAFAAAFLRAAPLAAAVDLPDGFANDVVIGGLQEPTAMAMLPDGRLLVTEQRTGKVRLFVDGRLAAEDPLALTVAARAVEQGLLGIAVDPRWPAFPYVYLVYTHEEVDFHWLLVRYTASGDLTDAASERLVLADPLMLLDDGGGNTQHHGGRLRFAADGRLFVSLGDHGAECAAQDTMDVRGKMLRIAVDRLPPGGGGPVDRALLDPGDNPFAAAGGDARLVWAMGLRNPWSFAIDPATGRILIADTGNRGYDELDDAAAGDNFGWPHRDVTVIVNWEDCPEPPGRSFEPPAITEPRHAMFQAMLVASFIRRIPGAAGNWRTDHEGDFLYGDYFAGDLRRLKWNGTAWTYTPPLAGQPDAASWATGLVSAVDFLRAPDGSLLWLRQFDTPRTGTGSLCRIRYTGIDSTTATLATLVRAVATAAAVRLTWDAGDLASPVELERRVDGGAWEQRGTLLPDGDRRFHHEDRDVRPGGRYAYRLALRDAREVRRFGEAAVTVPRAPRLDVRDLFRREADALVSFSVPGPGPLRLAIFDVLGRRAHESLFAVEEAGDHLVRLSGVRLASGVYLVRIVQGGQSAAGRIVIAP